tara:strand:+ start:1252 stop:1440 length:189 start_codon:yes stop_codon:yes gene_type:complete
VPVFQKTCEQIDGFAARAPAAERDEDDFIARRIGSIPASVHPDERAFGEPATQTPVGGEIDT